MLTPGKSLLGELPPLMIPSPKATDSLGSESTSSEEVRNGSLFGC